jgi:nanoRNase/pAp phosphatase (c-di-AMP/oligoRNAs hydrolase)
MSTPEQKIYNSLLKSEKILIIASTPVDGDSLGVALALKTWLTELSKKVEVMSFENFAIIYTEPYLRADEILHVDFKYIDFNKFDSIVIVDGASWYKALGNDWKEIVANVPLEKVFLIDHHTIGDMAIALGERALVVENVKSDAEVLYYHFFKKLGIKLNYEIASFLYYAHIYDTQRFAFISKYSYETAIDLLTYGIDHDLLVAQSISEESFRFTGWAIGRMQYYPKIHTMILPVFEKDIEEVKRTYGDNWYKKDLDDYVKSHLFRRIRGYTYGFTVMLEDKTVMVRWRTRNEGVSLDIAPLLTKAGFKNVGGHRNAGGGWSEWTVDETIKRITKAIEDNLSDIEQLSDSKNSFWTNY